MINLMKDLVVFKTVYPNNEEFERCFMYIREYFADERFIIREYKFDNQISMVISNCPDKEFDVILCGHIDVVPATDESFQVKIVDDIAYGRGVADMKGQDAVMMYLIKNINSDKKIALILSSDEERGGNSGVRKVLEEGYKSKVAIVPDGGFNFTAVIEEKGVLQIKVTVKGIEGHASMPFIGENAIQKSMNIYNKILQMYPLPKNEKDWLTSVNLSIIEGGDAINKIPSSAKMTFDIRHIADDKKEDIIAYIRSLDKDLDIEVITLGDVFKTDTQNQYFKLFSQIYNEVLKSEIKFDKFPAASDARFFSNKGIPCIMINHIGGNIHNEGEWTNISSLYTLYELIEKYVMSLE